ALIINAILLFINICTSGLNGAIKVYNFDTDIATLSAYIEKLDQLYSNILGQRLLSRSLRVDAATFISDQTKIYTQLLAQSPAISSALYTECQTAYSNY